MVAPRSAKPLPPKPATSWWAEPALRDEFYHRAAEEAPRMAASQIGHTLRIWVSDVGRLPNVPRTTNEADLDCNARR